MAIDHNPENPDTIKLFEKLKKELRTKKGTKVYFNDNGFLTVRYHDTEIFKTKQDTFIVDNGDYQTRTTKDRLNQIFSIVGIPFYIFQRDSEWYFLDRRKGNNYSVPFNKLNRFIYFYD